MKQIELKDKLAEMLKQIGTLTNYQDTGARKYAAKSILLYIIKEIDEAVEKQDASEFEFVIDGSDNFEFEEVVDLIKKI